MEAGAGADDAAVQASGLPVLWPAQPPALHPPNFRHRLVNFRGRQPVGCWTPWESLSAAYKECSFLSGKSDDSSLPKGSASASPQLQPDSPPPQEAAWSLPVFTSPFSFCVLML